MIEQQGKVVAVANGRASVRMGGASGCSSCDAGQGCGAGVFGRLLKRKPVVLEFENLINAEQGEPVMVGIPETLFLRMIARHYLYPLLAGIAAAALGYYLSVLGGSGPVTSDMTTLMCGLAGGGAVLLWNRNNSTEFPESFIVHLLRVIEMR